MKKPDLGNDHLFESNRIRDFKSFVNDIYNQNEAPPLYTGRYIAIHKDIDFRKIKRLFENNAGLTVSNSSDFQSGIINESLLSTADALFYEELGITLFSADDSQLQILESKQNEFSIQKEKIVYLPHDIQSLIRIPATWGINNSNVITSAFTGYNIKVAILDTGFDSNHPDFIGRTINSESFVPGENTYDGNGHGTHCVGIACGDSNQLHRRYGVAKNSSIYVGKVLGNDGRGAQSWILNGMLWAIRNQCKVISMSLGSKVNQGDNYDIAYEIAANFALHKGCIVVAAAGNDSERSVLDYQPVSSPADCPAIISVAAVNHNFDVADFSNRSINSTLDIDISSAGVNIYSSWPLPTKYNTISGTSMATPHVAGILALLWEQNPNDTPKQIIAKLKHNAMALPLNSIDIGIGFSMAP